jgi:peptidoglycan hydrolase-like protein with peptidoglycan-binding domain
MEFLAFVHNAVSYEDPAPDPEVTLDLNLPGSAGVTLAGVALAVATVSASAEQATAATTALAQGSSGETVVNVQKALGIEADGSFGPQTEAKVMDFQIRQGMQQVDGVVGQETATALGLNEQYQPTDLGFVQTNTGIGLNVRSGPGIDFRRIGGLEDGVVVETFGEPVERYYNWQRIGDGAWVATDYVAPYYEGTSYDPYDDYGYYPQSGDSCGCNYEPRSYDPCDRYYDERGYDSCDRYYQDYSYDDCYSPTSYYEDDYYYSPYAVERGGYVDTPSRIGLNIRRGPGLGYRIQDAVPDGTFLPTDTGPVYQDGYAWEQLPDGNWVASNFLN